MSLPTTMKATVLMAPHRFEYVDRPVPAPGDEDVLIRVRACGICGTDLKIIHTRMPHNVIMKLGGMMMRLAAYDYGRRPRPPSSSELASLWGPYIGPCLELFGADRCMDESKCPVDKMGIGWAALWNALKRTAAGASAEEMRALFAGTARRVYRLTD